MSDFCPSCNQYGCHLSTCVHGIASDYIQKYRQARSDYECILIDAMSSWAKVRYLEAENKKLNQSIQEMAKELHQAINEPMYAGTRKDWIWRAQAAEAEVEKLKAEVEALEDSLQCAYNEVDFYRDQRD